MAPNASDPKDLKLVLNPARRRALTILIQCIISHMRTKIVHSFEPSLATDTAPLFVDRSSRRDQSSSPSPDPEVDARQQRLEARLEKSLSTPKLEELRKDALFYFDHWAGEVQQQMKKICDGPEDPRSEQRRRDWMAARNPPPPPYSRTSSTNTNDPDLEAHLEAKELEEAKDVATLQSLYHPIPTRLTTISKDDRICVISCMVLLLLSLGHYSAHSRVLLCYLTSSFAVPLSILTHEEKEIAQTLLLASKTLTADAEKEKRQAENASARRWKVGLATVAGAAVIGITGGLAAPVVAGAIGGIMGGVGLGSVASFLGIFAMNGALVGSLFGAFGGKMTGEMVDAYAKEVEDFKFIPVTSEWGEFGTKEEAETEGRRLRVTIGINGWLDGNDDVVKPWRVLGKDSEVFALRYEMDALINLGESLKSMVSSYAWSFVKLEILKRTVLATLWSALWPVYLLKMATSIDNPFAVARNRSEKAGEVLADALINKAQGERPVTLIGYSLGSRVIYSCLKSLAERKAFGLIESVIFIGSPIPSNSNNWRVMRSVVSGKIINVYSENDYILAFLYRATSIQFGVAGLQEISDVDGVENLNLSKEVSGHLRYPDLVGKILKKCGFEGVLVTDGDIEEEPGEIQLVDIEFGDGKVEDKVIVLGLGESTDGRRGLGTHVGHATTGRGNSPMANREPTISQPPTAPSSVNQAPDTQVHEFSSALDDLAFLVEPVPASAVAPPQHQQIHSQTPMPPQPYPQPPTLSTSSQLPYSQPNTQQNQSQTAHHHSDSDSDSGGIQMVDNDSDGELEQLSCEPIPDDDHYPVDPRDHRKVPMFEEQKSLGSFPRGERRHDSPEAGSRWMDHGGRGVASSVGEGRGKGNSGSGEEGVRVRAGDMGLY